MWRIILTQFLTIMLTCEQSFATHGIFRVPLELQPTFDHQQFYVQPQQQLIVYPQLHQASTPQFYQSPQNLYIPQNAYSASRYIVQSTGGYHNPVVQYIQHQNPYQTSSFMNYNLGKKLFNQKPEEQSEKNPDNSVNPIEAVVVESVMEPHDDNQNEQSKKKVQEKMLIESDNSMETTTMLEIMKVEIENKENSTTTKIPEADSEIKV